MRNANSLVIITLNTLAVAYEGEQQRLCMY